MATNTELWDQLRTVPKDAQKPFKRAGGFSGTAIKPMWTYHRMTEIFGPCGTGWGIDRPDFQVIPAGDELLVYCSVVVWYHPPAVPGLTHHEVTEGRLVGVGGDKVLSKTKHGPTSDDEAFKKAFTDAVTNALKTLGAGADVHMGLYDGNKYVAPPREPEPEVEQKPVEPSELALSLRDELDTIASKAEIDAWTAKVKKMGEDNRLSSDDRLWLKGPYQDRLARISQQQKAA